MSLIINGVPRLPSLPFPAREQRCIENLIGSGHRRRRVRPMIYDGESK